MEAIMTYLYLVASALASLLLRLLYGFRIEGAENLPRKGPFIVLIGEGGGPICTICVAVAIVRLLGKLMLTQPDKVLSTMHEDLWVRVGRLIPAKYRPRPLRPNLAGALTPVMLDGYQMLRKQDGGVIINPEGSLSWDGRPLPIRPGAAWLGLRTAAPLVPLVCSANGYDIWPLWQKRPSLRGRVVVRVGQPFKLCGSPMERVIPQDLEKANARIRAEMDRLYFGPGGVAEWAGPPLLHGAPLAQPVRFQSVMAQMSSRERRGEAQPIASDQWTGRAQAAVRDRGIPLLLWRCPICHTSDTLIHRHPWFRAQSLGCQACNTRWEVRRVPGKDFRLKVVEGRPDLVGLEMALSTWYDEMKAGFELAPIPTGGVMLMADEVLYLKADEVELQPSWPNTLFDGWTGREPPRVQPDFGFQSTDWASIGTGQLFLTNRRLFWEGPHGGLDFQWPFITAAFLSWVNILGINYGAAVYRFELHHEVGLKWLTYVGTLARKAAAQEGREVAITF